MHTLAHRAFHAPARALLAFCIVVGTTVDAAPKKSGETHPAPKVYSCAGQLTRPADFTITMEPNKSSYIQTVDAPPQATMPVIESGAMTKAQAEASKCERRVIEVRVPSNTSSGCPDCYPNAEIHVCDGQFSGSKLFEHHCRVPTSSTSANDCKTFDHRVEVYKKASGAAEWNLTPIKSFRYRGFMEAGKCRVAAKYLGQIHDTSEVYPNVTPPGNGMDVYRVLSLPKYKGNLVDTVIFIEFEKMR